MSSVDDFADKLVEAGVFGEQEPEDAPADEPDVEEEPEEEEPEQEQFYGGKYRSKEELERAHAELENRLGTQGSELGAMRDRMAQIESYQRQAPAAQVSHEQVLEAAEQNPQQTAVWALQNAPHLYETVMDVWFEQNPRQASRFEQTLMASSLRDEIRKEFEPMVAPAQTLNDQQQFYQAWADAKTDIPDLDQYSQQILEIAEQMPEVLQSLKNGNIESKKRMITSLFWMARGRSADTLNAAREVQSKERAAQQQSKKRQATVLEGSGARPPSAEPDGVKNFRKAFREAAGLPQELPR